MKLVEKKNEDIKNLETIFKRADLVKFAKEQPSFKVRDLYLKTLVDGKPEKMTEWMNKYFVRE